MRRYDEQFKRGVLEYVRSHKNLTVYECAKIFGMGYSTLNKWLRQERLNGTKEDSEYRGDEKKEIVKLQRELQDAKRTLKVLKDAFELLGK